MSENNATTATDRKYEASWGAYSRNLEELRDGSDDLALVFDLGDMDDQRRIILTDVDGTHVEMRVRQGVREWCCALRGIVRRGVVVSICGAGDGRVWRIGRVEVRRGDIMLSRG